MAGIFMLYILGFDFLNIKRQVFVIFITEFVAVLISYGHIFSVKWSIDAPIFFKNKKKSVIFTYLLFFVFAGLILVKNNFFF